MTAGRARPVANRARARAVPLWMLAVTVLAVLIIAAAPITMQSFAQLPAGGDSASIDFGAPSLFVNPLLASTDTDMAISGLLFPGLLGRSPSGTLIPLLAQTVTVSNGGRLWTARLRLGDRWQNGRPVTASDVAATFRLLESPSFPTHTTAWNGALTTVASPRTVEVHLSRPDFTFGNELTAGIVPAEFAHSPTPVGSGPYAFGEASGDRISLVRSATENGTPSFLSQVNVLTASDRDIGLVCRTDLQPAPGSLLVPTTRLLGLIVNLRRERQRLVRLAFLESLAETDSPLLKELNTPLPTWPAAARSALLQHPKNPRRLLRRAGWRLRNGLWMRRHKALRITLAATSDPAQDRYVNAAKTAWIRLGVPVTVVRASFPNLARKVLQPGRFSAAIIEWDFGSPDYNPEDFWSTRSPLNFARISDPRVERAVAAVRAASSLSTRDHLRTAAGLRLLHDGAAVGVAQEEYACTVSPQLHGFHPPSLVTDASGLVAGLPGWYIDTRTVFRNPF